MQAISQCLKSSTSHFFFKGFIVVVGGGGVVDDDDVVDYVVVVIVYQIWPHVNLDKRAEHRRELTKNEMWRETCKLNVLG